MEICLFVFDRIHECDRWTGGQTPHDGIGHSYAYIASRAKNRFFVSVLSYYRQACLQAASVLVFCLLSVPKWVVRLARRVDIAKINVKFGTGLPHSKLYVDRCNI